MTHLKNSVIKYQDVLLYVVFGVLTTVVNIIVFTILFNFWHAGHNIAYVVAWFFSVLFAYVTNRTWVFHSQHTGNVAVIKEIWQFYVARILTGFIGYLILLFGVDLLRQDANLWNIIQNIFVIVANFILSKLIVFKRGV